MKKLLLTGIAVFVMFIAVRSAPADTFLAFGRGGQSCASWIHDPLPGDNWIMGFWSGMNAMDQSFRHARDGWSGGGRTGENTDGRGILSEVRKVCQDKPSASLLEVVQEVYRNFEIEAAKKLQGLR
jgi:hypothetical protein